MPLNNRPLLNLLAGRGMLGALVAAGVFAVATPCLAQNAPEDTGSPTQVEDVVVVGERLRSLVDDFVDEVTAPPQGRGVARWNRQVCVGTANFRREAAQAIIDRVSRVALDIGLDIGEPGCSPNILIIAAEDGAALADALVKRRPFAFRPPYGGASDSIAKLDRFRNSDAAVRWWHVALPVDVDTGLSATRMPGEQAPFVTNRTPGRLTTPVRNHLRRAFVIVDVGRAQGVSVDQLGDYVAMAAFAQIDPDAEVARHDTVLNLFRDPAAVDGMTDWDLAYLQSLYGVELNQRAPRSQTGAIADRMTRDRRRAQGEAPVDHDAIPR